MPKKRFSNEQIALAQRSRRRRRCGPTLQDPDGHALWFGATRDLGAVLRAPDDPGLKWAGIPE